MFPIHSEAPCLHETPSSVVGTPMKERLKSTFETTRCMVGRTIFCRQYCASGHLDMMCASKGTNLPFVFSALPVSVSRTLPKSSLDWRLWGFAS